MLKKKGQIAGPSGKSRTVKIGQFALLRCKFERFLKGPTQKEVLAHNSYDFLRWGPSCLGCFWLSLASPNITTGPKAYRGYKLKLSDRIFDVFLQSRLLQKGNVLL